MVDILGVKEKVNNSKREVFQNGKAIVLIVKLKDIIEKLIKALFTFTLVIRAALDIIA